MKDSFTDKEKAILKKFVRWGRRPDIWGEPTNPVLLLTTNELFMSNFSVADTWEGLGGTHKSFSHFMNTRTIQKFSEATQYIYLGLPAVYEDRAQKYRRKRVAKAAKTAPSS